MFSVDNGLIYIFVYQCVGVADPTSSLPLDSVFISGLKFYPDVFITRYPCTEKDDGKLIRAVISQPEEMSDENWSFLQSIPFGTVIFGPSSSPESLPEQISNGDLDGDLYHVFWDPILIGLLKDRSLVNDIDTKSDNPKSAAGEQDGTNTTTNNPDNEGMLCEFDIVGHEGTELLKIKWYKPNGDIIERMESLKYFKADFPHAVAQYALDNGLENEYRWSWAQKYIYSAEMKKIVCHAGRGSRLSFTVRFDDGDEQERSLKEMKDDAPDILFDYACETGIMKKWQEDYKKNAEKNWFDIAQDYAANLKLLKDQHSLKSSCHSLMMAAIKKNELEAACSFSQAYKMALDFRKHSCKIKLPADYIQRLPKKLQNYVMND